MPDSPTPDSSRPVFMLDGADFTTLDEAAAVFTRTLGFTMPWTGSLDALNDLLYGGFGTPTDGFALVWRNAALSRERLGHPATAEWHDVRARHGAPYNVAHHTARREAARRGEGPTLFDTLVEILGEHPEIDVRFEDRVSAVLSDALRARIAGGVEDGLKRLPPHLADWARAHLVEPRHVRARESPDDPATIDLWLVTDHTGHRDASYRAVYDELAGDFGILMDLPSGSPLFLGLYGSFDEAVEGM